MRRIGAALFVASVVFAGCAEDVDVSRDEAIEILVLDGVPRDRAVCIVDGVDGVVDLAKVTGVDPVINEDELADLAAASGMCTTAISDSSSIVDPDSPEAQLDVAEGGGITAEIDARVDALVTGGLDPAVGECVRSAIAASDDPAAALANANFLTEAIGVCGR
ncbi:MAG: hypothetical protein AAGE98_12535 [Actinomycetota bacterium]